MSYDRFEDPDHIKWAYEVKKRDGFCCRVCGISNVYLNSHHCNSWDYFPSQRFDIDNGVCLCFDCHQSFHLIYGAGRNTIFQFHEFNKIMKIINSLAKGI